MQRPVVLISLAALLVTGFLLSPIAIALVQRSMLESEAVVAPSSAVAGGGVGSGTLVSSYSLVFNSIPAPSDGGNGGAIATIGNDILLVTRLGRFSLKTADDTGFRDLPLAPPKDVVRQEALFDRQIQKDSIGYRELIARETEQGLEILVSYLDTDPGQEGCLSVVVSKTTFPLTELETKGQAIWSEVYRSQPCIPRLSGFFLQAGGAMTIGPDETLYVFMGDFGLDEFNRRMDGVGPQYPEAHVGKVIAIPSGGHPEVLSQGHRNPGGMVFTRSGNLFLAEHGPRGGDELNAIRKGLDFGWPSETLGAHYGELHWPQDDTPGLHDRFTLPQFSWVPSIAVSALAELSGPEFAKWEGNLLLATLKDQSLRRIRVEGERVITDERIEIGARVRDLAVTEEGRVFLKIDKRPLVVEIANANANISEIPRGLAQCVGCHQVDPEDDRPYVGPTLVGVWGRAIGSAEGFEYSETLQNLDGQWDAATLGAFLRDTQAYAPGSSMPQLDVGGTDIRFIVKSLSELSASE